LTTQDDAAAALALEKDIHVFTWRGETNKEYYDNLNKVLDYKPNITIDDGCDLITLVHTKRKELLDGIIGGCEETTTGVNRLKIMEKEKVLRYPVMDVNDSFTKYLFDNRYGTGQSVMDGIMSATNLILAGKNFVVCGYGWCGKGVAMRAKGMGSNVIVTEVDVIRALEASMDGFRVMPLLEASKVGDIFVTTTGNKGVIRPEHIKNMKDGAILSNAGHFDNEIDKAYLEKFDKKRIRDNLDKYTLGNKRIYLLAEGRLVNLVAGQGHPAEIMDMSFSNQALASEYLVKNKAKLEPKVYKIPDVIDRQIAEIKLQSMDISIDKLTQEQKDYLNEWREGT
ncbi:MAG: adenosylhomocysteinase, partial [Candidatus Altiarchaeota archaeon]|nr:adenosylhomocysteinase [Candidatus Altiarchaeota archaeon]